ncbi:MAG TPA: hypothetical protein VFI25_16170 [Planctomycetota bacterium]|nr:hypothetical protein [Planctomycetota bacterium]
MDPTAFLQQNRKFLIGVSLGAVVFLVGRTVTARTVGDSLDAALLDIRREGRKLREQRYGPKELKKAREVRDGLAAGFEALRARVEFVPNPRFVLPEGASSPSVFYLEATAKAKEELRAKSARADVEIDERLGLPPLSPPTKEEIRRTLRALDLAHRLVDKAIDARVRRIEEIRPAEARGRRKSGEKGGGGFLDEVRISLKVSGPPPSVARFLEDTQRGERIVPLGASAALVRSAEREGEVVATLEFAAIEVHPEREP